MKNKLDQNKKSQPRPQGAFPCLWPPSKPETGPWGRGWKYSQRVREINCFNIDTDEIPGFFLLLKNHIFIAGKEDTIFIFHVGGYWCRQGY